MMKDITITFNTLLTGYPGTSVSTTTASIEESTFVLLLDIAEEAIKSRPLSKPNDHLAFTARYLRSILQKHVDQVARVKKD